ncbi:hypothetical protein R2601_03838 [Salipiger bermudensis HTCC2601]|uniref:Uncharacterized protein n=1 Tax=Salipiger bermudensis (strain DSM 26914 / JCM 13377 / KCTC 12554 / HTCC2601) TaxID=314265 RepID=Q0FW78_SALBH|nr:hypothetical protein R2601_03838 [Salipiger bermudensis HTCC2601]
MRAISWHGSTIAVCQARTRSTSSRPRSPTDARHIAG